MCHEYHCMKRIINRITFLLLSIIAIACGEDRTYEYLELTKENHWIYSQMQEHYYWNDYIKEPSRDAFFHIESKFFASLVNSNDKISYFQDNTVQTSYGMSFAIIRDPLGIKASNYYALVIDVAPGSPADKASIVRGTWITKAGKNNISTSSYASLQQGDSITLCTSIIDYNDTTNEYEWLTGDTITMEPSAVVEPLAIKLDTLYEERGKRIGYIVCNNFDKESIIEEMRTSLSNIQNAEYLIIDLRYNSSGTLNNANAVANLLLSNEKNGSIFCSLKNNKGETIENGEYIIEGEELLPHLNKIYLLTGSNTAGAAEAFIAATKNNSNKIVTLGENSAGVQFYTQAIESPYGFTIHPVIAEIYSLDGTIIPSEGITPDYFIDEFAQFHKIYPIGDKQEYMLYSTMHLITSGGLPRTAAAKSCDTYFHLCR